MKLAKTSLITEAQLLDDLNGTQLFHNEPPPSGLKAVLRMYLHAAISPGAPSIAGEYTSTLRRDVDLWLRHRSDLERQRRQQTERQQIREKTRLVDAEWKRISHELNGLGKRRSGLGLSKARKWQIDKLAQELDAKWQSLQAEYKALNEQLSSLRTGNKELKDGRERALEISAIVQFVAEGHRVLPIVNKGGYGLFIRPADRLLDTSAKPKLWKGSPAPKSNVDPATFPENEDGYFHAVYEEKLAELKLKSEMSVSPIDGEDIEASAGKILWQPRKAAWLVFAEMLMSDWRARIAKCTNPGCVEPYFRLGKWNTDSKASLCLKCRKVALGKHRQENVEDARKTAEEAVLGFVATQFQERIQCDPLNWYKDRRLQATIARSVTGFIENSNRAVQNRYRGQVSPRWIASGRGGNKNWFRVEQIIRERANAKS